MSVIVIDLNAFSLGYDVYYYKNDKADKYHCSSLDDIATFVPEFCFSHNIPKVLISGIPEMAHELATKIYRVNTAEYANKSLEIEVI